MLALLVSLFAQVSPAALPPERHVAAERAIDQVQAKRLESSVRRLESFGTRHSFSSTDDPKRGIGAARKWIVAQLEEAASRSEGRMTVTREAHEVGMRDGKTMRFENLIATIRGSDAAADDEPVRTYVFSGHYDSRATASRDATGDAPGANDDGSGTAAVLEVARVLAEVPLRATVRLVCYDGEELGLIGSRADAKALAAARTTVDAMATLDIVGNTRAADGRLERGYVRAFSYQNGSRDSNGRNLARTVSDIARRYLAPFRVKLILRGDRYGRGGDHRPFAENGWPAIRLTEPFEDFSRQHKNPVDKDGKPYGDYADFMDFAYLAQVTRLTAALAIELAMAPAAPPAPRVRGTPTLDTRVRWRVSNPPDLLAGWEIVWRSTTDADWKNRRFVPVAAQGRRGFDVLLEKLLVDDSIVGLRSVGIDGARSRFVSAPEPGALRRR